MNELSIEEYLNGSPEWERKARLAVVGGQEITIESIEQHDWVQAAKSKGPKKSPEDHDAHAYSLTQEQHPEAAYAGPGNPSAAAKFIMGTGHLGEILSYRVPGGVWFNPQGKITKRAKAFLALVGPLKKIPEIEMATNTKSRVFDLLIQYEEKGEEFLWDLPPALQEMARDYKFLLDDVREKGFSHYEREYGFSFVGSEEEKLRQALAVEIGFKNMELAKKIDWAPKLNFVVQIPEQRRYMQWHAEEGRFVKVVPANLSRESAAVNEDGAHFKAYISSFPQERKNAVTRLANGLSRLLSAMKLGANLTLSGWSISTCSDSRTVKSTVAGKVDGNAFRTPGIIWTNPDGRLCAEARQHIAFTALTGDICIKSNEATCGAMTAIWRFNKGIDELAKKERGESFDQKAIDEGEGLPEAFKELGRDHRELYETVKANGIEYYRAKGLNILGKNDDDKFIACLAAETVMMDVDAAAKDPANPPLLGVFQNLPETRNYVFDTRKRRFLMVPLKAPGMDIQATCTRPAQVRAATGSRPKGTEND